MGLLIATGGITPSHCPSHGLPSLTPLKFNKLTPKLATAQRFFFASRFQLGTSYSKPRPVDFPPLWLLTTITTRWPRGIQTVTPRPMFRVTGGWHRGSRINSSCSWRQGDKAFVFNNIHILSRGEQIYSYPQVQAVLKNKHVSNHIQCMSTLYITLNR